jgi:hypothetical protein
MCRGTAQLISFISRGTDFTKKRGFRGLMKNKKVRGHSLPFIRIRVLVLLSIIGQEQKNIFSVPATLPYTHLPYTGSLVTLNGVVT